MAASKRLINRLAALARAPLCAEQLAPELVITLQRAIGTDGALPVVLMTAPGREPMHAFSVWRGAESNTDELRALLQAGVWPGPSSLPSPQRMVTEKLPRTVYAAPLWGDGCDENSPWEPLWRERHVRHGYYLVEVAPSGRTVVALLSRRPASPAFNRSDIAQGEAVVRFIANAADRTGASPNTLLAAEVPITFDGDGKLASIGMGGPELLRDLGGGRDGARAEGRRRVESAVTRYVDAVLAHPSATVTKDTFVAGPPEDSAFKRSHFALMFDGRARVPRVEHMRPPTKIRVRGVRAQSRARGTLLRLEPGHADTPWLGPSASPSRFQGCKGRNRQLDLGDNTASPSVRFLSIRPIAQRVSKRALERSHQIFSH